MSVPQPLLGIVGTAVLGFGLAGMFGAGVLAKLPPPTEEQQAASVKKGADVNAQLQKEQEALTRAQDRVAEHYRRGLICAC